MLKLVKPNKRYFEQYKEMMDEWMMEGSRISPWPLHLDYHTKEYFCIMLEKINNAELGIDIGDFSPSTTYWVLETDKNRLIGAINIRHYLTELGLKTWGHIGYGVRPSERLKGNATKMLKMALTQAKQKGIDNILIGIYEGNIGSWKTVEKCGAKMKSIIIEEKTGLPIRQYWIKF